MMEWVGKIAGQIKGLIVTLYPDVSQSFAKVAIPHTTDEYEKIKKL